MATSGSMQCVCDTLLAMRTMLSASSNFFDSVTIFNIRFFDFSFLSATLLQVAVAVCV
jgi:hypothetical protein